ncbi:MAG TPA: alpha/beta hydrolase [Hyphomonadaceae bacterium]|jgi:pimeloyl-ACP methyl ester carboxylesterase|nr:alpha/beta hydrolase [Hyphomonadaceae bacterium]
MRILAGVLFGALLLGGCMSAAPDGAVLAAHKGEAVEDKYATSPDGVRIHYVASGKGPLIVAIHGYPDFSATWDQLRPWLDDSYRFVALDTRGYNLSGQPVGVANYEMPKLIADVDAVIKSEGYEKATILGHDWGGSIAWMFAFYYPQRMENLIVLSTPHPTLFMQQMRTNPAQQASSQYARNYQKEGSEATMTAEGLARRVTDPVLHEKYLEAFKRSSFAGMMNYYRANYPKTAGPDAVRPFMPDPVPQIEVPLLIIHGMKDQALLAVGHAGTWDKASKDTTIMMIPEAGHFVQQDAADRVNPMIRNWLDMHRAKK